MSGRRRSTCAASRRSFPWLVITPTVANRFGRVRGRPGRGVAGLTHDDVAGDDRPTTGEVVCDRQGQLGGMIGLRATLQDDPIVDPDHVQIPDSALGEA